MPPLSELRITEIFHSLQGESRPVGYPTAFVRLTGCPLRCNYCDTAYAFQGGQRKSIADVLVSIVEYRVRHVCVTGGEPLAQPACLELLVALCDAGYLVSLETSGALDTVAVDRRVTVVLDLKTPSSGECARNLWSNLAHLKREDQVKFVICNRTDYDWACEQLRLHELHSRCEVLFSPAWEEQPARELADWILADRLPVRFQVQLH
ncbi:MAG: 7-carboxy-7-deazaguanine synthase QueE, partial [Gammaproteobacteria bacterium]|nr:7-carboxy-7-deazaguanine synthase QueE [Gammaproteobacteria bacterium]